MTKTLDCDLQISEFECQLRRNVFGLKPLGNVWNLFLSLYTAVLLQEWLLHWITHEGWYANEPHKEVHIFPTAISSKVNVITRVEFELTYYYVEV